MNLILQIVAETSKYKCMYINVYIFPKSNVKSQLHKIGNTNIKYQLYKI